MQKTVPKAGFAAKRHYAKMKFEKETPAPKALMPAQREASPSEGRLLVHRWTFHANESQKWIKRKHKLTMLY
ncbi:MAG: hypothetical protein IPH31_03775 [Lewinellaceae bacterium]|nr:hypothetical protein [Lewinellaceae bacterium]